MGIGIPRLWRASLGISVLALACLQSTWSTSRTFVSPTSGDVVSRYEERLRLLRPAVQYEKIVGYVTDLADQSELSGDLYLTQYVLAPTLVERSQDHRLVVGSFHALNPDLGRLCPNAEVVVDYGNGVMLLRGREH